jgi:hypothetical protein
MIELSAIQIFVWCCDTLFILFESQLLSRIVRVDISIVFQVYLMLYVFFSFYWQSWTRNMDIKSPCGFLFQVLYTANALPFCVVIKSWLTFPNNAWCTDQKWLSLIFCVDIRSSKCCPSSCFFKIVPHLRHIGNWLSFFIFCKHVSQCFMVRLRNNHLVHFTFIWGNDALEVNRALNSRTSSTEGLRFLAWS